MSIFRFLQSVVDADDFDLEVKRVGMDELRVAAREGRALDARLHQLLGALDEQGFADLAFCLDHSVVLSDDLARLVRARNLLALLREARWPQPHAQEEPPSIPLLEVEG